MFITWKYVKQKVTVLYDSQFHELTQTRDISAGQICAPFFGTLRNEKEYRLYQQGSATNPTTNNTMATFQNIFGD